MTTKIYKWKNTNVIAFFIIYWLIISVNVVIANKFDFPNITEWWINTIVFLLAVLLCILTYRIKLNILYRLLFLPASWLSHAVLTAAAAFVMGIIKFDPNHLRTDGEHRAVFILASLPVLFFVLSKSKLFIEEIIIIKSELNV